MMADAAVFLDANVLVYALDKTSEQHHDVVAVIQKLLNEKITLCTSHHVIEEVLHIVQRMPQSGTTLSVVVEEINRIPNLVLIEPAATIDFAQRYAALSQKNNLGVNDALILQLMLDSGITTVFSYDRKLLRQAQALSIEQVTR
jgi:predicted nucleic acid-binding protein